MPVTRHIRRSKLSVTRRLGGKFITLLFVSGEVLSRESLLPQSKFKIELVNFYC